MSVDVLRWEGFLQGEEIAHLATEPEREARFAPLPITLKLLLAGSGGMPCVVVTPSVNTRASGCGSGSPAGVTARTVKLCGPSGSP